MNTSDATFSAPSADAVALRGVSLLAYTTAELGAIETTLRAAAHWRPAQALLAELLWCRSKIEQLGASWGRKLVVALVGPSGAGKSTLLNVLAGRGVSPTSRTRPTTHEVVIYTRSLADAEDLLQHCGADRVRVETDYAAEGLEHLILVDTPDTNTLPENQALLSRVLERADLLLALFPAHNPKMHDNIAFLRPYVRQLPPDAVVPVLNWVDRVPRQELEEVILPDFRHWVAREWGFAPAEVYMLSAKASLPEASFPEDERPLHDLNQIGMLRAFLFASLNRAGQVTDRRLARAEHLLELLKGDCRRALAASATARAAAVAGLGELGRQAREALMQTYPRGERAPDPGLHTALYATLGQRWWGPVGWLVMLWALVLRLGASLGHLFRRPRLSLSLERGASPEQEAASLSAPEPAAWIVALRRLYAQRWPPLADALVLAGLESSVRQAAFWESWVQIRGKTLAALWGQAQHERLAKLANVLSSWPLQLFFNASTLGMVGWVCVQTVSGFFQRDYLPADYFRHAAIATATVWLTSFILLQLIISLALRSSMRRAIVRVLAADAGEVGVPLSEEFAAMEALERLCQPAKP